MEEVDRCMAIVTEVADVHPYLRWNAEVQWPHRLLLDGRIAEAEAKVYEAFQVAQADEQPDAAAVMASQLVMVRWDQGRLPEMEPQLQQVTADNPGIPGFRALLAVALCEADRVDDAHAIFQVDAANDFEAFQYNTIWLGSMVLLAEVGAATGDRAAAEVLYDKLRPWRDQIAFTGVGAFGCVAHYLGQLATVLERFDDGERDFAAATAMYERMGAVTFLARTRLSNARLLLARGRPGDADRARDLLGAAAATASDLGLSTVVRRTAALLS